MVVSFGCDFSSVIIEGEQIKVHNVEVFVFRRMGNKNRPDKNWPITRGDEIEA